MSSRISYMDYTVSKSKKITWTIDLTKKESVKKKTPVKAVPLTPPKTLYEFIQRHIDEVSSKTTSKIVFKEDSNVQNKILRKLAKKIIKCKKVHVHELADEFGVQKKNLISWLNKGEKEEQDYVNYDELIMTWVISTGKEMSIEELYDVINRYTRSMYKSLYKGRSSHAHKDIYLANLEAVVLDNSYPKKKIHVEKEPEREDKALDFVHINVVDEHVYIKETILWDSEDKEPELALQFANGLVNDLIEEKRLKLSPEKIDELVRKIQRQIIKQVITANDLKEQTDALITFNGNQTTYKQKECILKIIIRLKHDGANIVDTFDWEVDPSLNKPENFALQYVKDNNLPTKLASVISGQIKTQLSNYLRKRLNNFLRLYEPKIDPSQEEAEATGGKKATENKIKDNILYCLNENLESLPTFGPPSKAGSFLKNPDLFAVAKKYADFLAPAKKKIFQRQKVLFEQNSKKIQKSEIKKSAPTIQVSTPVQSPYIPESPVYSHTYTTTAPVTKHVPAVVTATAEPTSPVNAGSKPHNLRRREHKTNYRVLGGDLVNPPPIIHEPTEKKTQHAIVKGPSLPTGQLLQDQRVYL